MDVYQILYIAPLALKTKSLQRNEIKSWNNRHIFTPCISLISSDHTNYCNMKNHGSYHHGNKINKECLRRDISCHEAYQSLVMATVHCYDEKMDLSRGICNNRNGCHKNRKRSCFSSTSIKLHCYDSSAHVTCQSACYVQKSPFSG